MKNRIGRFWFIYSDSYDGCPFIFFSLRKSENKGLPERWRYRYGAYYYRVPEGMEAQWGGKKEYRLGKTLSEAYKAYADKLVVPDELTTMRHLFCATYLAATD